MAQHKQSGKGRMALICAASMGLAGPSASAEAVTLSEFRTMFREVVLKHEYEGGELKPLMRWEVPVHLSVRFGASVSAEVRAHDMAAIRTVTHLIARTTGHSITLTEGAGNFFVFVVSQTDLQDLGPTLQAEAGLSAQSARSIARMPPNTNCLVSALAERDKTLGYRNAVAVIRADLPPERRESCFYEEIAQGMGLPDDCRERLTIFNDDDEFSRFTAMDLAMMRVAYDRRLRSGMTAQEVLSRLDEIVASEG